MLFKIYVFNEVQQQLLICFASMDKLHIGSEIKGIVEAKGISITEFSKRINKSRENVYSIFNRKTIDTGLLFTISKVLEFDFFSLYIPLIDPSKINEIDTLKNEINLLREINKLLKDKYE